MVRKSVLALALLGGALHLVGAAQASVADGLVSGTAPRVSQVQFAQFNPLDIPGAIVGGLMFGGHNYCWYDDGWSGTSTTNAACSCPFATGLSRSNAIQRPFGA